MIGRQVKHRTFGMGTVISYEDGKMSVDFSGTMRLFRFPESFERFLATDDPVLQRMVADAIKEIDEARQKAEEEQLKAREAVTTRAAQTASCIPFSATNITHLPGRQVHESNESVPYKSNLCNGGRSGNWIIPCNPRWFDIISAYEALRTIDWAQWVKNIETGDIAYIYVSKPFQAIMYKTRVVMVDIAEKNVDYSDAIFNLDDSDSSKPDRWMRLELIKKYPSTALTFDKLRLYGLKGNLQGQRRTGEIIQSVIDEYEWEDNYPDDT